MISVRTKQQAVSFSPAKHERGQVLLLVVLVMVVALTVGLSVATRSITNLRTSTEEESSQRAFSAAEAGLEQTIKSASPITNGVISESGTRFQTSVEQVGSTPYLLNNGAFVPKDDGFDVWLSEYPNYTNPRNGTLNVYWGQNTDNCNSNPQHNLEAAVEIIVISGPLNDPDATHFAFDPCPSGRRNANNFTDPQNTNTIINSIRFRNLARIPITAGRIARIVPLYAGVPIGISFTGGTLPSQGNTIVSTGSSGDVQRRIEAFRGYPKLPNEFFQYLIFSP